MKYYLMLSNTTGQLYIHTDNHVHNFTCIKSFETKHQAIEYYRMIVNGMIGELMELAGERGASYG